MQFREFLEQQQDRDDKVGDLARLAFTLKGWHGAGSLRRRFLERGFSDVPHQQLNMAEAEYRVARARNRPTPP